jgi:hypothetical protein
LNLWQALRRECTGAWRSVRYDLATNRAAKVAGAYTEEFRPSGPPVPAPSRLVPLTGVTLLLAGGAAGAFLAISGGIAAIGGPAGPPPPRGQAATAPADPVAADGTPVSGAGGGPVTPRRAAGTTRPSPTPEPTGPPAPPPPPPVIEGTSSASSGPAGASSSAGSPSPSTSTSPSASQSSDANTEGPRSRGPRGRR